MKSRGEGPYGSHRVFFSEVASEEDQSRVGCEAKEAEKCGVSKATGGRD